MASDFRAHQLHERLRLLDHLVPLLRRSSLRKVRDEQALVDLVSDQMETHDFNRVNGDKVAKQLVDVCQLLSCSSQQNKASLLGEIASAKYG